MTDQPAAPGAREDAGKASAEDGVVILDGPNGVAVTMTADAASRTADSLHEAAREARAQRDQREGTAPFDNREKPDAR